MNRKSADQIRQEMATKIVEAIEAGTVPWRQSWGGLTNTGAPANFLSGRRYTGVNPLLLMLSSFVFSYSSRYWGTAASWLKNVGARPKEEQYPTYVVLFNQIPKKDAKGKFVRDAAGNIRFLPLIKEYPLVNVEQLEAPTPEALLSDGELIRAMLGGEGRRVSPTPKTMLWTLAERYLPQRERPSPQASRLEIAVAIHQRIERRLDRYRSHSQQANSDPDFEPAERLFKATKAKIVHGGDKPCYDGRRDIIHLPEKHSFQTVMDYYQTGLHELVHWTEHKKRVGRKAGHSYAFGELVAEIGSCFVMMEIGAPLSERMMAMSQSYLAEWLKEIKKNPKYLFEAAAWASKATDYLLSFAEKGRRGASEAGVGEVLSREVA